MNELIKLKESYYAKDDYKSAFVVQECIAILEKEEQKNAILQKLFS